MDAIIQTSKKTSIHKGFSDFSTSKILKTFPKIFNTVSVRVLILLNR